MGQDLHGKVALVTGGASGVGLLAAQRLHVAGAQVVVADIAREAGQAAAAAVDGRFVALDVSDPDAWNTALEQAVGPSGHIDVAHLNAGVATGEADITALSVPRYRAVMGVNVDGVVFGVRAVLPRMPDGGVIVATASLGGLVPMPTDPIYSMGKHAVIALVRSLAPSLAKRGVTINAVCPGFADTPLVDSQTRAIISAMKVPLLDPAVVADVVLRVVQEGRTGEAWFCQPGRDPAPYEFRGVPGPRPVA